MRAIALLKAPDPRHRRRADDREHAGRPGDQAGRRADRRAAGKTVEVINTDAEGRLILGDGLWYAQAARRHAPGRRRHADRRVRGRARQGRVGPVRPAGRVGRASSGSVGRARRRSLLADAALRRVRGSAPERDRRHDEHRRPAGRRVHGGDVPQGVRRRTCRGPTSTSPARRGRTKRSRGCRKGRPASPSGRWRSWRSRAQAGSNG